MATQATDLNDWRVIDGGLSAWFDAPSQAAGAQLIERIAARTDPSAIPDVDLRARGVRVRMAPHDVAVAEDISAVAADLGLVADPAALQSVQFAIAAADRASVAPFWQTLLAYERSADHLSDPARRDPRLILLPLDEPRPLRNRIHVDVSRMRSLPEVIDELTAVGAGRRFAGDHYATLADPEGNEVDFVPGDRVDDSRELADWYALFGGMTRYPTATISQATRLATTVAGLADDADWPLLIDLRPGGITIDTGKDRWEESRFIPLAQQVQSAAHELGLAADPRPLCFVQFGIDGVDIEALRTFWQTVLGYELDARPHVTDIYDPRRLDPPIFFQQMDAAEEDRRRQRNRMRLQVHVPYDSVRLRIDTALTCGGRIVEADAPARWIVADPEGNEVEFLAGARVSRHGCGVGAT